MKKYFMYLLTGLLITSALSAMLKTKDPLFVEFEGVRNGISSGHNDAFGGGPQKGNNLFNNVIDSRMWDNAINVMQQFVIKILDRTRDYFYNKDATILNALGTVANDGRGLARNIQLMKDNLMNREALRDPMLLAKAQATLQSIVDDMITVQRNLQSNFTPTPKEEKQLATNLLYTTAMFIQVTAETAMKHAATKAAEIMSRK